jgi:putative flippase GtrA
MQFLLYLIVGGLSFVVEIAAFIALRRVALPVIPASVASYLVATLANYLLSVLLAFQRGRFRRHVEMARFLTVVLVGLALNTALVWCFVYLLAIPPLAAKIGAVPIVLIWNYLGRRMLVFTDRVPAPVQSWLDVASRARFGRRPSGHDRNAVAQAAAAQRPSGQAVRSRSTSA